MRELGNRAATLKYRTEGTSGVRGLKIELQNWVVRLEYAGESSILRRRVVKEVGSVERRASWAARAVAFFNVDPGGGRVKRGDLSVYGRRGLAVDPGNESGSRASRKAPMPMFACSKRSTTVWPYQKNRRTVHQSINGLPL